MGNIYTIYGLQPEQQGLQPEDATGVHIEVHPVLQVQPEQQEVHPDVPEQPEVHPVVPEQPEVQEMPVQPVQQIQYYNRLPDPDNYYGPSGCIKLDEKCGYVSGTIRIGEKLKDTEINIDNIYYVKCKIFGERRFDLVAKFINNDVLLIIACRQRRSDNEHQHNNWYQVPSDYYWKLSLHSKENIDIYKTRLCFNIGTILMCCTKKNLVFLPPELLDHIKLFV